MNMVRAPCCSELGLHRGPWSSGEDTLLIEYIQSHGEGSWNSMPKKAGLLRCGKSCRLRWMNYLRPGIKLGNITADEDDLIVRLHSLLGNRWSLIAGRLPGRTDNEIKNYWNTHISKRLKNPTASAKETMKQSRAPKRASKSKSVAAEAKKSDQDVSADGVVEEITTTKAFIHHPKPIRVSPFSIPAGSFNHGEGDHDNLHVSWSDEIKVDDIDFREALVCDSVKGFDFVQVHEAEAAAARVTMTWKLKEEYQQLLQAEDQVQLESFVDSFLI